MREESWPRRMAGCVARLGQDFRTHMSCRQALSVLQRHTPCRIVILVHVQLLFNSQRKPSGPPPPPRLTPTLCHTVAARVHHYHRSAQHLKFAAREIARLERTSALGARRLVQPGKCHVHRSTDTNPERRKRDLVRRHHGRIVRAHLWREMDLYAPRNTLPRPIFRLELRISSVAVVGFFLASHDWPEQGFLLQILGALKTTPNTLVGS